MKSGDHATALAAALPAWRATRDAAIADAIAGISALARPLFTVPEARTNADFQNSWLAVLKSGDPVAVGWLAEALFEQLPGSDADAKVASFGVRLREAAKQPDPRIASALVRLAEQAAPIVRWAGDKVRKTLVAIGDAGTRQSLEAMVPTLDDFHRKSWKPILAKLPATKPVGDAERARWAAVSGRPSRKARGDVASLYQAVLASPHDDEPRIVLADALQEIGDPRGEFMALQLAEASGQATVEAVKRADALLKKHKKEWLGAIGRVTYRARFRRGFLDELELDGSWKANDKGWKQYSQDPSLATVTQVTGKATPEIYALFVGSPGMRALRSVRVEADVVAETLAKVKPAPVRELISTGWKRKDYAERFASHVVPLVAALPNVNAIECGTEVLDLLRASSVFKRIESLRTHAHAIDVIALWRELPAHVRRLSWGGGSEVELVRVGRGASCTVRIASAYAYDDVDDQLKRLAAKVDGLVRLELVAPKKLQPDPARLATTFGKKVEIVVREPVPSSGLATGLGG